MARQRNTRRIPLPQGWQQAVKSAMLHVISLAQYTVTYTRSWAVNSQVARVRLKAENDQLRQHAALLTEELRIKDARMMRIPAQKRPHYLPTDRMSILEVRAAHGWNMQQTATTILVTTATIASWMSRLDERGADSLVQSREPVNRFPDFVRYAVQRLKAFCVVLAPESSNGARRRPSKQSCAMSISRQMLPNSTQQPAQRSVDQHTGWAE